MDLHSLMDTFQLNVLIDSSGKAVLCDFGLSRIKANITSSTVVQSNPGGLMGSRNWMAPELLLGQSLKKPCDIYAFAMTLYEVSYTLPVLRVLVLTHLLVRYLQMRFHWVISAMLILLSLWSGRVSDLNGQMMRMPLIYQMQFGNLLKNVG